MNYATSPFVVRRLYEQHICLARRYSLIALDAADLGPEFLLALTTYNDILLM
jgi:hypothetical protein